MPGVAQILRWSSRSAPLSRALHYNNGWLSKAATRGDGRVGEDVTPQVRSIRGVPGALPLQDPPEVLEVRGEVYYPRAAFEAMNSDRVASGELAFANPRNAASGALRQKDPAVTATRPLQLLCHGGGAVQGRQFHRHSQFLGFLRSQGLPVAAETLTVDDAAEVMEFIDHWGKYRHAYEIDGVVDGDLIADLADIYYLERRDITQLDGFGPKKADGLLSAIEASRSHPLERLLVALGVRHVGPTTARVIARHLETMSLPRPHTLRRQPGC